MVSRFYQNFSKHLLCLTVLSFPLFTFLAESLESNNSVESWLSEEAQVRVDYGNFKSVFGAEEIVFIALSGMDESDPQVPALARRIEKLNSVHQCWSPQRLRDVMQRLEVPESEIRQRFKRLVVSDNGRMVGLIVLMSEQGLADRETTVDDIREQLAYCQLTDDQIRMAGAPIVVKELNRLGNRQNTKLYFIASLFISVCLLYYKIRQWNVTLCIVGLIVWAINLTLATVNVAGGEMNFILSALPVMVMVFTMAIAIHLLHYLEAESTSRDPLGTALGLAWKPCLLATLTTGIGLLSLGVSDIGPVRQFGYAAAWGAVVALITGLGLPPAVLTVFPIVSGARNPNSFRRFRLPQRMLEHSGRVALVTCTLMILTGSGLMFIRSRIDPLDFLPRDSKVLLDAQDIERQFANTSSIEAVVDFGNSREPFLSKLEEVRELERRIAKHPAVQRTMSLATFFPTELPESPLEVAQLLAAAKSRKRDRGYIAGQEQLWRISARIVSTSRYPRDQALQELQDLTAGEPITFTGIAPLLQQSQAEIFKGFWESFTTAFLVILVIMIVSLRSIRIGLIAMVPNLPPICLVFGMLGWCNIPVDIGMMMTASIALGIAVDGTFHFLLRYREHLQQNADPRAAARAALLAVGNPVCTAALIAATGMLALTLSDFYPTVRFGYMMAAMMVAAVIGDLILLPALLCLLGGKAKRSSVSGTGPHFQSSEVISELPADHAPHADPRNRSRRVGLGLTCD